MNVITREDRLALVLPLCAVTDEVAISALVEVVDGLKWSMTPWCNEATVRLDRNRRMMRECFISPASIRDISERYGLSSARAQQVFRSGCRRLTHPIYQRRIARAIRQAVS